MGAKPCIFCQTGTRTNEHVFSKAWLRDVMPGPGPFHHRQEAGGVAFVDPIEREWPSNSADIKVRCACTSCNSGWMNDLDDGVKDLATKMVLDRGALTLRGSVAKPFARWVFKTAVVADQMQSPPVIPANGAIALFNNGEILPGTQIWLARTEPIPHSAGVFTTSESVWTQVNHEDGTVEHIGFTGRSNVFPFMGHVGYLVLVLLAPVGELPPGWNAVGVGRTNLLVTIWPFAGLPEWPPVATIPYERLQEFASTFI